jgi:hypothetical protein
MIKKDKEVNINKTTVVDLTGNPKNAALYFDYVLPLNPVFLKELANLENINFLGDLLPERLDIPAFELKEGYSTKSLLNSSLFSEIQSDRRSIAIAEAELFEE